MSNNTLERKGKYSVMTIVCMIGFFLSNISYLPYFAENGLTQYLSYPAWALILGTVFLYKQWYLSARDVKFVIILLGGIGLIALLQGLLSKDYFSSLLTKCFMLVMVITLTGGMVARTRKTWNAENLLFYSYITATVILCLVVFKDYLVGQDLSSLVYSYRSKNETAFLTVGSVIMLLYMQPKKETKVMVLLKCCLIAFFVYIIACMRCRSMLIGVALALVVRLFHKGGNKGIKVFIALGFVGVALGLLNDRFYDELVNNILFASRDSTDINALSSGRLDQIAYGWGQFEKNVLLGTGDTYTVDCFYVSALMQYGLFIGGALIVLGVYPLIWGLWNYKRIKTPECMIMILCTLAFAVGGIFEENAPFGPGVRCYISWFLFGYLRVQQALGCFEGEKHEKN